LHPILFHVGDFAVASHPFFIGLGLFAAAALFFHEARRRGTLDDRLFWVVIGTLACGGVAARIGTVWRYTRVAPDPTLVGALLEGGRSILGGLAGAYVGAIATKRLIGYRTGTGDLFAPAVALGMAIGRWGCFLSEQIGTPTTLPWGLRPNVDVAARIPNCQYCTTGVAMHPSFIYEIIFHLVMFAVLWWGLRPRVAFRGELFKIYLLSYAIFRFLVEFVRGNEVVWNGLTRSQIFLVPSTLLLAAYFVRRAVRAGPAPATFGTGTA
jgi:prolipoprotein diacylglyceryl transferase